MNESICEKDNKRLDTGLFVLGSISLGLIFVYLAMQMNGGDRDFLWHTMLGKLILENKSLPVADTFSWLSVERGYTEFAHSWLGSVLISVVVDFFSDLGYNVFFGGRVFALFWYVVCMLVVYFGFFRGRLSIGYTVSCALIGLKYGVIRMQNMSDVIFLLECCILFKAKKKEQLYWLPLLTLVCANIHGGMSPLLIGLGFVYLMWQFIPDFSIGCFEHKRRMLGDMRKTCFVALLLSCLTILVNPYGFDLCRYFMHVQDKTFPMQYICEWQPIPTENLGYRVLLILLLAVAIRRRKTNVLEYGVVLGFTILSFKCARFMEYGLVGSAMLLSDCGMDWHLLVQRLRETGCKDRSIKSLCLVAQTIVGLFVVLFGSVLLIFSFLGSKTGGEYNALPVEAVECLKEQNFQRPYCEYNIGSSLIYEGFQSFVDSREDLFGDEELHDMMALLMQQKNTDELDALLDKYQFDGAVLFKKGSRLFANYIGHRTDWELCYDDGKVVIYRRL